MAEVIVKGLTASERIDAFLSKYEQGALGLSRSKVAKGIEEKWILVNTKPIKKITR